MTLPVCPPLPNVVPSLNPFISSERRPIFAVPVLVPWRPLRPARVSMSAPQPQPGREKKVFRSISLRNQQYEERKITQFQAEQGRNWSSFYAAVVIFFVPLIDGISFVALLCPPPTPFTSSDSFYQRLESASS